jgi:hypothetical protein
MRGKTRVYHILESLQYGILYLIAAFIGGVGLDFTFPHADEKKTTGELFREVTLQCLLLILVVIFVRYCVKSVPILFPVGSGSSYVPYQTAEFDGEMMMGLVFLSSQLNLLEKINILSHRLYAYLFNEERVVKGVFVKANPRPTKD